MLCQFRRGFGSPRFVKRCEIHLGLPLRGDKDVPKLQVDLTLVLDGFSLDLDILVDRYDYSGHQITSKLTQQLPFRSTLVLSSGYETQTYDDQVALDAGAFLSRALRFV